MIHQCAWQRKGGGEEVECLGRHRCSFSVACLFAQHKRTLSRTKSCFDDDSTMKDDDSTTKGRSFISVTALKMPLPSTKFLSFGFSNDLLQRLQTINGLHAAAGFISSQKLIRQSHRR